MGPTSDCTELGLGPAALLAWDVEALVELVVEQAAAGRVGLEPLAIDDELRDGALADVAEDFVGGGVVCVNIDLGVFDAVGFKKLLGGAAVAAPRGGVNQHLHDAIVLSAAGQPAAVSAALIAGLPGAFVKGLVPIRALGNLVPLGDVHNRIAALAVKVSGFASSFASVCSHGFLLRGIRCRLWGRRCLKFDLHRVSSGA